MLCLGLPSTCSPARTERGGRPLHQRDALIDLTRGLLFLLMTHSHALALAHVSVDSFWQSGYWLTRGWATVCFILLSGYTVGLIFTRQAIQPMTRAKMRRRRRTLTEIIFQSNVTFLALAL